MRNWIVCILIVFCFILNSTPTSSGILLAILMVLFLSNLSIQRSLLSIKCLLIFCFGVSFVIALTSVIEINQVLRLIALSILFWTYPINYELKKQHLWTLIFVGIYLVVTQIGKTLDIESLKVFIDANYPIEENVWGDNEFDSVGDIFSGFGNRLGGIYYNPNIMGQSMLILYVVIINGLLKNFSKSFVLTTGIIFFLSILLTGGRTAMLTFIIINLVLFRKEIQKRFILLIPFLISFVGLAIYYGSIFEFRAFYNLTGSFSDQEDSGGQKIQIFLSFFEEYKFDSIHKLMVILFGSLNWDRQFDADPGYLISFFGIIGSLFIILFFVAVFKKTPHKYRFVFLLFLVSVTATIVINYRYSILMFLILSLVNNEQFLKRKVADPETQIAI